MCSEVLAPRLERRFRRRVRVKGEEEGERGLQTV